MVTEVGLLLKPNRPYAEFLKNSKYAEGTVLSVGLRLPKVEDATKKYPIVKEIKITYDYIRHHRAEIVPQGFSLDVTLGNSAKDELRGIRLYFTATSGLDPVENWQGKVIPQDFVSNDSIGEFTAWGSNEWEQTD